MPKKRYTAEEIIHKLRGAYVLLGQRVPEPPGSPAEQNRL
jgi:hypothetical protein